MQDRWVKRRCQCVLFCLPAGLIRLRSSPPPHLQGVEYVLNVTAVDDNASGGPQALSSTAQVIVGVDDVNNNKPVFEKVRWLKVQIIKPCSLYLVTLPHCFSPVCLHYLLDSIWPSGGAISHFEHLPRGPSSVHYLTLLIKASRDLLALECPHLFFFFKFLLFVNYLELVLGWYFNLLELQHL